MIYNDFGSRVLDLCALDFVQSSRKPCYDDDERSCLGLFTVARGFVRTHEIHIPLKYLWLRTAF